jgi:hypothetical protein
MDKESHPLSLNMECNHIIYAFKLFCKSNFGRLHPTCSLKYGVDSSQHPSLLLRSVPFYQTNHSNPRHFLLQIFMVSKTMAIHGRSQAMSSRLVRPSWIWSLDLHVECRNPSFGRECERVWKSVRMKTHTPKWAPILGVGVLVDSRTFRELLQGSKHLALRTTLYHWKVIQMSMFKMGLHDPLGHL